MLPEVVSTKHTSARVVADLFMTWELTNFKDLASIFQSLVTPIGLIVAGVWAYRRYVLEDSKYPHIETSAEIEFIGRQGDFWIVELKAILINKGRVQHKIEKFGFDLNAIYSRSRVDTSDDWGGQVDFPHKEAEGSFLPQSFKYFVIGPSVTAKYSYVAKVPKIASFLILHCWFDYCDDRGFSHTMEKTVAVPTRDLKA